jgi:hypothetical protein
MVWSRFCTREAGIEHDRECQYHRACPYCSEANLNYIDPNQPATPRRPPTIIIEDDTPPAPSAQLVLTHAASRPFSNLNPVPSAAARREAIART